MGNNMDENPEELHPYFGRFKVPTHTTVIPPATWRQRFWLWRWNHIWRHFFTLEHETRDFWIWRW
jgi:hypothetical protein